VLVQPARPYTDKDVAQLIGTLTITKTDTLHDEKLLRDAAMGLAAMHGYASYLEALLGWTPPYTPSQPRSAHAPAPAAPTTKLEDLPAWRRLEILCAEYETTIAEVQDSSREASMQEKRRLIASRLRTSGVSLAAIASLMGRSQQTVDGWLRQVAATQQRVA
jgi:hypothetical protein